ncbi:GD10405 [Drosophila simulans]|uniref:GD10405 n=1 Tax=Drosophila simulans TaxID=7240 RepID=B4QD84_DROSI|nr:GD10405 [Drosophila simulans]
MDRSVGGSPPDRKDPFRRSSTLSRSPTKGAGNPTQGDGISVPAVARAQSLLAQTEAERNVDIMLLSESYVTGTGPSSMILDESGRAAIKCCSSLQVQELATSPMRGIAYAKIKHMHMYSCYAPPSDTPDQFEEFLEALVNHARGRSPKIIAGDFNGWAVEWGSRVSNPRGRAVIDAIGMLVLVLLNDGRKPTFNNDRGTSFIDVNFSRSAGQAWDTRKIDEVMLAYQINSLEIPNGDAEASRQAYKYAGQTLRRIHAKKKEGTAQTTRVLVQVAHAPDLPYKAPGLDGIPGAVIKAAALGKPGIFTATFQQCLLEGIFPKSSLDALSSVCDIAKTALADDHASYASKKAAVTASSLARLIPNVGAPRYPARKLLVAVAKASLLYAAPILSIATSRGSYLKGTRSVLRSMAIGLIRGFRTISEDTALALSGLPPIDLEIKALSLMRGGASRLG